MKKALIQSTIPILASLDLDETLAFYVGKLGFVPLAQLHDYAIVGRDGAEIHFYSCQDRHLVVNNDCSGRTGSTTTQYESFIGHRFNFKPQLIRP